MYAECGFDRASSLKDDFEGEGNLSVNIKNLPSNDNFEIEEFILKKKKDSKKFDGGSDEKSEKSKISRPLSAKYKTSADQKN